MQINIICVGKLKEPSIRDACAEYIKRLSRYHKVAVRELPDEPANDDAAARKAIIREGERILEAAKKGYCIGLAIEGREDTSESFARRMRDYERLGEPVNFIIGGSGGLSDSVKAHCKELFSMSRLTFPHNLARLLLLEQIYRAAKINSGETYHK